MTQLPETQYAVQLVGPDKLVLNKSKSVHKPGGHQIDYRDRFEGLKQPHRRTPSIYLT